jgi:hypothetical protein
MFFPGSVRAVLKDNLEDAVLRREGYQDKHKRLHDASEEHHESQVSNHPSLK